MSYENYPDQRAPQRDLIRFIDMANRIKIPVKQEDGSIVYEEMLDSESLYWGAQSVGSEHFARLSGLAAHIEATEALIRKHMPGALGEALIEQMAGYRLELRRVGMGKNSETMRLGQPVSALIDKTAKTTTEKRYTSPNEATQDMLNHFTGRDEHG